MSDEPKLGADGVPSDGVGHNLATPEQLAEFKQASEHLSRFRVPTLVHANARDEKLFIALFDGTGNNKFTDPLHATNVAQISDQIELLSTTGNGQVHGHYLVGPGTQPNRLTAMWDSATGTSYAGNIKDMYEHLVLQANRWKRAEPDAVIRLQAIGFSRGGSQAAGFSRVVHEKGIPDLSSRVINAEGQITYTRHHVAPGKLAQVVGLFDPVATGAPMQFDRRLPPSVVSGFQITASDELRATFPSDEIIPPGFSEDGRFLNLKLPGAHSDMAGGYLRDGLSIRCGNLMIDYCNAIRDEPFLQKRHEPQDPRLNVIHRSTEGNPVFRLDPRVGVRGEPSGTNTQLAPPDLPQAGPLPHRPEPMSPDLIRGATHRPVPIAPSVHAPDRPAYPRASPAAIAEAARSVPFAPKVGRGLGAAAMAVDVLDTATHTADLLRQGNNAGSRSEVLHFASRNMAGWAGAEAFAVAGAAAGVESGPGLFITGAIGGLAGYIAGDKLADTYDRYRIYHQRDPQGYTWQHDPGQPEQGWVRDVPPLPGTPHGQRIAANPALANRLNYQASGIAAELALARARTPQDPYTQPAAPGDTSSLREAPWKRDPHTQQWTRQVTDRLLEHGVTSTQTETANAQRSVQLDRAATQTIQHNLAESPLGIAKRYREAYVQQGWAEHGAMPEAVNKAWKASVHEVLASDDHTYERAADGQWSRPGKLFGSRTAEPRITAELEATREATLAIHQAADTTTIAQAQPNKTQRLPSLMRLDDSSHPDHAFFAQIREQVGQLDRQMGRTPDRHTDNIAAALTVQARSDGLRRIDHVALSEDRHHMWAVQTPPARQDHLFDQRTHVPTTAANTPVEQSSAQWPQAMQQFMDTQAQARNMAETQEQTARQQGAGLSR